MKSYLNHPASSPARVTAVVVLATLFAMVPTRLIAQSFNSGSDGSDGALSLTTPGTVIFDPASFTPPLDPDGDNIFHFTTITIGGGVTVRLSSEFFTGPVFWLASGNVVIDGTLDLTGEAGQNSDAGSRRPSIPGAGGFAGGVGRVPGAFSRPAQEGLGPGGGGVAPNFNGASASHVTGSKAYGNIFLVPLVGGSGGAGGDSASGTGSGGGGAGGGAILIASSNSIAVEGAINVNGGSGGSGSRLGGSGSGGSLRLVSPTLTGSGDLRATGGSSSGRIRLEAFNHGFVGSSNPASIRASPFDLFLAESALPTARVTTVDGVPVPAQPGGTFTFPDVTIANDGPATLQLEGRQIPLGTVAQVHIISENGADQVVDSTPLSGTVELSSATATVTLPSGFSRGFVRAVWTP